MTNASSCGMCGTSPITLMAGHQVDGTRTQKKKPELVNALMPQVFQWCRQAKPTQPLTSGVWKDSHVIETLDDCKKIQIAGSDVVSYHCYGDIDSMKLCIDRLKTFGRRCCAPNTWLVLTKHLRTHLQAMEDAKVRRIHVGLCQRQESNHLSVGFMD